VKRPICGKHLTTYSGQDRIPLPLKSHGIADWYQHWPKGTENPQRAARGHFLQEHQHVEPPCGIKLKNKKRDIAKLPNGKADRSTYASLRRVEKKVEEKAANGTNSKLLVTAASASLFPSADKPQRQHKKALSASRILGGPHHAVASTNLSMQLSVPTVLPVVARPTTEGLRTVAAKEAAEKKKQVAETSPPIPASKKQKTASGSTGKTCVTSKSPATKVEVKCPVCGKHLTTYSGQYWIPLPLTPHGIPDWYQNWPKGTENPLRAARVHFIEEHNGIEPPCGIRSKKRDIAKLSNGKADKNTYTSLRRGEKKAEERAANGSNSKLLLTAASASLPPSVDKPHSQHKKIRSASQMLG
jgi:hypothetical protein